MSNDSCILTTKDFTILEVMLDRCLGKDDPMAPLLRRKIDSALVVFRDDVPGNVATMSSRVVFSFDGRDADTRILSHDSMKASVGLFLPVTTFRGLALLGLTEGQEFTYPAHDGLTETIFLEHVLYQPEASRREKNPVVRDAVAAPRKPALTLIRGAFYGQPESTPIGPAGFDDPSGPSAA